jgi:hypothetical protein
MEGIHKNITIVLFDTQFRDAATRLFIDLILRHNRYLGHVHGMLGSAGLLPLLMGHDDAFAGWC